MRTNQQMRGLLKTLQVCNVILSPEISSALSKGFVEEQGCVLLASEAHNTAHARVGDCFDETGFECFINHVHITGLQEALEFARRLTKALAEGFTDRFFVIVSFDGRDATVRFHKLRSGQAWLNDNLEVYKEEGIAVLDSWAYMNFDSLSDVERAIVGQALRAAADGPFFPDWEFHTLFGLGRSEVRAIADSWPEPKASLEDVEIAVSSSLNNLVGYPHRMDDVWSRWISVDHRQLNELSNRLRHGRAIQLQPPPTPKS